MTAIKSFFVLITLFAMPMGFAVTKKVGDGPIFLTIKNKTDKGYVAVDRSLPWQDNNSVIGIIKPNDELKLSGFPTKENDFFGVNIMLANSVDYTINREQPIIVAEIPLYMNTLQGRFNATLMLFQDIRDPLSIFVQNVMFVNVPVEQLRSSSFVINVTLEGENLEKSDIDLTAGVGTVNE